MDQKDLQMAMKIIPFILTFAVGFAVAFLFFKPKTIQSVVVETKERVDTVYQQEKITLAFDSLLFQSMQDSIETLRVLYAKELAKDNITIVEEGEPIQAPIRQYSGFEPTLYGNIGYNATIAGSLLKMAITQDLKIPTVTHTIETTKTITNTYDLRGIYAGASISDQIGYKVGASYVDQDWQFSYDYQPREKIHWVGVRKRLFKF